MSNDSRDSGEAPNDLSNPYAPPKQVAEQESAETVAAGEPLVAEASDRRAWLWVPSLYFAEAVPYMLVMTVAVVFYKNLEVSNSQIALFTSMLYWPWVIKPLWSPLVDVIGAKRLWIVAMQIVIAVGIAGAGLLATGNSFFAGTMACFCLLAFASATHDIAADGFYMIGLSDHAQAWWVGIRSSFYRLGFMAGGLLIMTVGMLEQRLSLPHAWRYTFLATAMVYGAIALYHAFSLPRRETVRAVASAGQVLHDSLDAFATFFSKPGIGIGIAYILFYRFAEGQLAKLAQPFLLDTREAGGLAMTNVEVGFIYNTVGVLMLVVGGIVGGLVVARFGLGRWLFWMALAINIPNLVYVVLAYAAPEAAAPVAVGVAVEQFGYGFGFAGYMLYMLYLAQGEHQTAHYALCTGIMALGMMLPGMISGYMQELLGYKLFFWWVMLATVPSFIATLLVKVDPKFGRRAEAKEAT